MLCLASALAGSRRGLRQGRELRSRSPFPRSASHLRSHWYTVSRDTPAASAVAATVHPSRSTRNHLPYSVSRALGLAFRMRAPPRSG
jgi:hypothetical protein